MLREMPPKILTSVRQVAPPFQTPKTLEESRTHPPMA
jgi:hypothetical protein